jgi:hypothetical protein
MGRCGAGRRCGRRRADGCRKRGLQEVFDADVLAEIEAFVGAGSTDGLGFEALEMGARWRALALAARVVERQLNTDRSDGVRPTLPCPGCGRAARSAGRREKTFTTALGLMRLQRAYYHCDACAGGFCPRDRALGLAGTSLSPAVNRMVGQAAARVSFAESSTLLGELAGVRVEAKQVERTAEALGAEIARDERHVVQPTPPSAPTMYLGMDGTGVPLRAAELKGRPGKQPDGSAKTREVKLVTLWTAERRDLQGLAVRDPGSISYSAAIESAATPDTGSELAPFAQRVEREARRRGFDQARRRVVLGDGAPWIWNLADEIFPGAVQIVDLYHAKARLWEAAKAIYGAGSDLAEQWAKQRRDELDRGELSRIVKALRGHAAHHEQARLCLLYIVTNRRRMRYPNFRALRLCVATGVVEAGCKVVVGTRLKRAGMHWTSAGADAILALRCSLLNGRFDDFWQRRTDHRQYPTNPQHSPARLISQT